MAPQQTSDARVLVRHASPLASRQGLSRVKPRARRWKRWLNRDHPYNGDVVQALNAGNIEGPRLAEYIAASAPLHLADGWTYLSSAFESASRGNRPAAIHLSYYAELRAAMSLLATEGVGIFNQKHVALNAQMQPMAYQMNTHRATWLIFTEWSRRRGRAENLLDTISVESRTLTEWLADVRITRYPIARDWLKSWSIDLQALSEDSSRRNEVSYRPTRISVPHLPPVKADEEIIAPLFNVWVALEPSTGTPPGAAIDSSLLREAIGYAVKRGLCPYPSLDDAIDSLGGIATPSLVSTLKSISIGTSTLLDEARRTESRPSTATPMLARAFLLLRLASASAASLLRDAGLRREQLEFWWKAYGQDLGLWVDAPDVETFSELWLDISDAIDEAEDRVSVLSDGVSVQRVSEILGRHSSLMQFSRAPLWLLGLD